MLEQQFYGHLVLRNSCSIYNNKVCQNRSDDPKRTVGKPVNVMYFENGSDNLYPNPLIGSQYGLQWTYKAADWKELGTERSS